MIFMLTVLFSGSISLLSISSASTSKTNIVESSADISHAPSLASQTLMVTFDTLMDNRKYPVNIPISSTREITVSNQESFGLDTTPLRYSAEIKPLNVVTNTLSPPGLNPNAPIWVPGIEQKHVLELFYSTDRETIDGIKPIIRGDRQRGYPLNYGQVAVTIPINHQRGSVERPLLKIYENSNKHFVIQDNQLLDEEEFFTTLNKLKADDALVFFHGFNVTFEDAARRTAQLTYDLRFDGTPIFYSWPAASLFDDLHRVDDSLADISSYVSDGENIKWSQSHIEYFLKGLAENSDFENIYIIAHSMGTRGLTRAYGSLIESDPKLAHKFKHVILVAPDIDEQIFERDILPLMRVDESTNLTIYASSHDLALKASEKIHDKNQRLGLIPKGFIPHLFPNVETIDVSNIQHSGGINHSYYGNEVKVLDDLMVLINEGKRASDRPNLQEITIIGNRTYWKLEY